MCLLLFLLLGDSAGVLPAQSSADRTCLLRSQVEWQVLLLLVEEAQLVALVRVDHSESAGDGFAEVMSERCRKLWSVE